MPIVEVNNVPWVRSRQNQLLFGTTGRRGIDDGLLKLDDGDTNLRSELHGHDRQMATTSEEAHLEF